jgi:anti-sigma B factor antagonist
VALILNTRQVNGHIIVEATGKLEFGESCLQLRELAKRLTHEGGRFFVLDLSEVSSIDSAGLGLLLSIYATIRNHGGELKLLNVSKHIREMLRVMGLIHVFQMFEDENVAIRTKSPEA